MTFKYRVIITNRHLTIIETLLLTTSFQLNTLTARDIILKHDYGLNLMNYYTNETIMAIFYNSDHFLVDILLVTQFFSTQLTYISIP